MKILRHSSLSVPDSGRDSTIMPSGCVATIGNFDGLHRGHQYVLQQVKEKATELALPATVISFEPLPFEYFQQPLHTSRIYPLRDKVRLLEALGIEQFACLRFDAGLADREAPAFAQQVLLDSLQVRYLVVGDDFRFGRQRKGDFRLLQALGKSQGMHVVDTPTFNCAGHAQRISSTRIREHLQQGELPLANALLGMNYQLSGRVRQGDKLGRTIAFPTLNMRMPDNLALKKGVYAVRVRGLGREVLSGVANLGTRPTVSGKEMRLEVHLFDFDREVYGHHILVEPSHFIRAEERFASFEDLRLQIAQDAQQARTLLEQLDTPPAHN